MKKSISLLLLSLIFSATTYAQENPAFSQPVINVGGSKNPLMIKQQVRLFLNHLDIRENLYLTILFSTKMPKRLKGYTVSDPSPEPDKYQLIRIMIDARMDRRKQLLVLAHEMIHVKQYAKKELKVLDGQRVMWKEKEYFASRGSNHHMPWEEEAYHADLILVREVKSSPNQMQKMLAELTPKAVHTTFTCQYSPAKCTGKKQKEPLIKESPGIISPENI